MKKLSKILLLVLMAFIAVPSFVLADCEKVLSVERISAQSDTFTFRAHLDNVIEVDGYQYKWGVTTKKSGKPTNYYNIENIDYENDSFDIILSTENAEILNLLKSTDTAFITIVNDTGTTDVVIGENFEIDLRIPLLNAFTVDKNIWYGSAPTNPAYDVSYPYTKEEIPTYVMFEKITDAKVINGYLDNSDLNKLPLKGFEQLPSSNDSRWTKTVDQNKNYSVVNNNFLPEENGLYYMWLKTGSTTYKTIYGYKIIEIGTVQKEEENKVTTTTKKNVTTTTKKVENTTNNKVTNTTQKKEENPKTADTNVLYILAAMLVFGAIGVIGNKKAKNN